jgi:hypothetical protein
MFQCLRTLCHDSNEFRVFLGGLATCAKPAYTIAMRMASEKNRGIKNLISQNKRLLRSLFAEQKNGARIYGSHEQTETNPAQPR